MDVRGEHGSPGSVIRFRPELVGATTWGYVRNMKYAYNFGTQNVSSFLNQIRSAGVSLIKEGHFAG
jgi:hypothetical protein